MNGAEKMVDRIRSIAEKFPDRVAAAIYQEAQIEMTESKRRCPVDTGVLRASGFVALPVRRGRQISVTLSYGGAAIDYAIYVHENLEAHHPVGQAKFLESVIDESRPYMLARVGARLHLSGGA